MMRGAAQCFATRGGMGVRRVGPNGDVDGHRRGVAIRFAQQAGSGKARVGDGFKMTPQRLSETLLLLQLGISIQSSVELTTRFFRRPETAVGEHRFDIFAGLSGDGDFKIMDRGRSV